MNRDGKRSTFVLFVTCCMYVLLQILTNAKRNPNNISLRESFAPF